MARLRQPAAPPPPPRETLPARLETYDVRDWPPGAYPGTPADVGGVTERSWRHNRPITLWMLARQRWAAEHGMAEHDLPGPRPRRRLFTDRPTREAGTRE